MVLSSQLPWFYIVSVISSIILIRFPPLNDIVISSNDDSGQFSIDLNGMIVSCIVSSTNNY